jgi:hypothetical protein
MAPADCRSHVRGDVNYQPEIQIEKLNFGQIPARTLMNAGGGISKATRSADLRGRRILNEKYVPDSFFIICSVPSPRWRHYAPSASPRFADDDLLAIALNSRTVKTMPINISVKTAIER